MSWRRERPPIDPTLSRYFVYQLRDEQGTPIYVGRSCDVAARLRSHYSKLTHRFENTPRPTWLVDARSVAMVGPYTWDEACRVERAQIEAYQPRGNRMHTKAHGYRPLAEGGGQYLNRAAPP